MENLNFEDMESFVYLSLANEAFQPSWNNIFQEFIAWFLLRLWEMHWEKSINFPMHFFAKTT